MPESNLDDRTAEPLERRPDVDAQSEPDVRGVGGPGPATTRWIIIVACAATAVIAGIWVSTGRAPAQVSLRAETADYHVRLDLDGASLGSRTATIEVLTEGGKPVANAAIDVRTAMPAMGMPGALLPARQTAPGRYEASGELFTMLGDWTVTVRISEPGPRSTQEAVFAVRAVP
jgi:YtkA-like